MIRKHLFLLEFVFHELLSLSLVTEAWRRESTPRHCYFCINPDILLSYLMLKKVS